MQNKLILSIDFSLTGSAFIVGLVNDLKYFTYFSSLQMDKKNEFCTYLPKEYKGEDKLDYLITHYLKIIDETPIGLIVLEAPSFNSRNTSNDFKGGYELIKYFARQKNIPYLLIPPISNKLFFTENAKASKDEMVEKAKEIYGKDIDFESISSKHQEDVSDALSLFKLGSEYLRCNRLPAPKGYVDTQDIKPFECLPLHQQQVIAKLYNREDLYNEVKQLRQKHKKSEVKNGRTK